MEHKVHTLVNELQILIAREKEFSRSRGKDTIVEAAYQPEAYPISREVYEAVFTHAFAMGERSGKAFLAGKIVDYLK